MKTKAFTLAEVLITLGIIGVIAAMTIPRLVSKYNEIVAVTQLKKTYVELQHAIKMSEVINGSFRDWDYSLESEPFAKKYIMPYLAKKYIWMGYMKFKYKTPGGREVQPYTLAEYYYNDKMLGILVQTNTREDGNEIKYVNFYVDINGKNGQGIMGKDVFIFTLFNYTYNYGAWEHTPLCQKGKHYGLYQGDIGGYWGSYCGTLDEMFGDGARGGCNIAGSGTTCGLAIEKNGWKVPENYPIKF